MGDDTGQSELGRGDDDENNDEDRPRCLGDAIGFVPSTSRNQSVMVLTHMGEERTRDRREGVTGEILHLACSQHQINYGGKKLRMNCK